MKDKIEVGEYVRTKSGLIGKFYNIEEGYDGNIQINFEEFGYEYEDIKQFYNDIAKHSKNIIDLIEVGDYVNGKEVKHIAMFEGFPDYPKLIFVDETHLIPSETCENEEIKSILTHEQYSKNCYKVGDIYE